MYSSVTYDTSTRYSTFFFLDRGVAGRMFLLFSPTVVVVSHQHPTRPQESL